MIQIFQATLPKLTIGAKEQLSSEIEGMLEDFRNLKVTVYGSKILGKCHLGRLNP